MRLDDHGALGLFLQRLLSEGGASEVRLRLVGANVEVSAVHAGDPTVVAAADDACTLSREGRLRYSRTPRPKGAA